MLGKVQKILRCEILINEDEAHTKVRDRIFGK